VQIIHDSLTVLLVEEKPGLGREPGLLGLRVVLVNLA
jgi:hypothetical protein